VRLLITIRSRGSLGTDESRLLRLALPGKIQNSRSGNQQASGSARGRVQRWDEIAGLDGTLILFLPESVPPDSPGADPLGPITWRQAERPALVRLAADHLRREYEAARAQRIPGTPAILYALLKVLLLRVNECAPVPPAARETFRIGSFEREDRYDHGA
jgi:hypothetical protein